MVNEPYVSDMECLGVVKGKGRQIKKRKKKHRKNRHAASPDDGRALSLLVDGVL